MTSTDRTAADVQAEFDAFKERVVETARRYAQEHSMCEVVEDALDELGLVPGPYEAEVVFRVRIRPTDDAGTDAEGIARRIAYLVNGLNYFAGTDAERFEVEPPEVHNVRRQTPGAGR